MTETLSVSMRGIAKGFGNAARTAPILKGIELEIPEGEFIAILGFSGSGKTTLVSLLAGLISPDQGEIRINGAPIAGPGPDRGIVFQNYSLLPWLSVRSNVMLAVAAVRPDWDDARRRAHVDDWLARVKLGAAADKLPRELSGGMRQRVSVARALSTDPKILLLDEPFSALDALTRASLQDELEKLWREDRKTVVMVTNDVDEGLLLADRIIVMTPGPGATLEREWRVALPRPRDRQALNHDPSFVRQRSEIMRYLLELSPTRRRAEAKGAADAA